MRKWSRETLKYIYTLVYLSVQIAPLQPIKSPLYLFIYTVLRKSLRPPLKFISLCASLPSPARSPAARLRRVYRLYARTLMLFHCSHFEATKSLFNELSQVVSAFFLALYIYYTLLWVLPTNFWPTLLTHARVQATRI